MSSLLAVLRRWKPVASLPEFATFTSTSTWQNMFAFRRLRGVHIRQYVRQDRRTVSEAEIQCTRRNLSSEAEKKPQALHNQRLGSRSVSRTRRRYVSKLFQNFGKIQPEDLGACQSYKVVVSVCVRVCIVFNHAWSCTRVCVCDSHYYKISYLI